MPCKRACDSLARPLTMRSIFRGWSNIGLLKWSTPGAAEALPNEDPETRQRECNRDEEEEEPGRKGLVRADAEIAEEADEERLPHRQPVDGERYEQDEEAERAHHGVRPRREVDADGVAADREREADGRERQRRRSPERPLEQNRGGDRAAVARVAAGGLVDPDGVAPDRRRQHLAACVGDEVGSDEPAEPVVDPLRGEQPLPAPGHRPDREHNDRDRGGEVREVRVHEYVHGLADVDLPEDVGGAETGDDERPGEPDQAPFHRLSVTTAPARAPEWLRGDGANRGDDRRCRQARVQRLDHRRRMKSLVRPPKGRYPQLPYPVGVAGELPQLGRER